MVLILKISVGFMLSCIRFFGWSLFCLLLRFMSFFCAFFVLLCSVSPLTFQTKKKNFPISCCWVFFLQIHSFNFSFIFHIFFFFVAVICYQRRRPAVWFCWLVDCSDGRPNLLLENFFIDNNKL